MAIKWLEVAQGSPNPRLCSLHVGSEASGRNLALPVPGSAHRTQKTQASSTSGGSVVSMPTRRGTSAPSLPSLTWLMEGRKADGTRGQLASSAPSPPLQLRAADPAGARWHAPWRLYSVCPSLEAEPNPGREAAKGTQRRTGEGQTKSAGSQSRLQSQERQRCRLHSGPGPAALRSPVDGRKPGKDMGRVRGRAAALQN